MKELTQEQKEKVAKALENLVQQVLNTQDVLDTPLTKEEVTFLVEKYNEHRMSGKRHEEAVRLSYGCAYRGAGRFNPRARVEELRNS